MFKVLLGEYASQLLRCFLPRLLSVVRSNAGMQCVVESLVVFDEPLQQTRVKPLNRRARMTVLAVNDPVDCFNLALVEPPVTQVRDTTARAGEDVVVGRGQHECRSGRLS